MKVYYRNGDFPCSSDSKN